MKIVPFWEFIYIPASDNNLMERIFAKSTLRLFWEKHSDTVQYLKTWYDTAMNSDWKLPMWKT